MKDYPRSAHYWTAAITGAASLGLYHLLMRNFFPNPHGGVGHDYSYFLARLLDGCFWWRENGFFSIPWFTPSFLGGVPFFPNPQSMYHSLPQALTMVMDPLTAVYLSILIFAAAGYLGFYLLLAGRFSASPGGSALGAFIFMFNGFYMARMIVGHFAFHSFMLAPWIIYFILPRAGESARRDWARVLRDSAAAGIMFAYMAYSGGLALAQVFAASILAAGLIHSLIYGGLAAMLARLALSGLFGLGLSAGKLVSGAAFLGVFPRDDVSPVARGPMEIVYILLSALFLPTDGKVEMSLLANRKFFVALHEFDFSISPGPLFLTALGIYIAMKTLLSPQARGSLPSGAIGAAAGVILIFLIPLALNCDSETAAYLANSIPLLKNATRRLRWIAVYIPPLIIISVIALESSVFPARWKTPLACAMALLFVLSAMARNWDYYLGQGYDPAPALQGWRKAAEGSSPFRIESIGVLLDKEGAPITRPDSAVPTFFVMGVSPIYAYEPIFGYKQHKLPPGALAPGPAMMEANGRLNLRNPACFIFPQENACAPGDLFAASQRDMAEAFRSYRPFPFAMPFRQKAANAMTLLFMPLTALALLGPRLTALRR